MLRKCNKKIAAGLALTLVLFGFAFAPIQPTTGHIAVAQAGGNNNDIGCDLGANFDLCISNIVYAFTVWIPTEIAYAAGYVFNFAIQLGLNSGSYALDFLSQGWTVVRDIANLAFIFILIYIAYTIIMEAETSGTMRMLASVVVMALLINFSFFFTRVVIDAGNILAVQFYNAVPTSATMDSPLGGSNQKVVKDFTAGIMDSVGIQALMSYDSFKQWRTQQGFLQRLGGQIAIYIAFGVFLALLAFSFLIVGVRMITRIVVLWIAIIASPLAFAAYAIPDTHRGHKLRAYYDTWFENLIESTFYPAVFLFLFYVMSLFLKGMLASSTGLLPSIFDSLNSNTQNPGMLSLFAVIANVGIRIGIITVMLYYSVKFADSFSKLSSSAAGTAMGWVGGKVGGATGWAGRAVRNRTVGAIAYGANEKAKNIPLLNTYIGAAVRRNTVGVAANSSVLGSKQYKEIKKTREENKAERDGNLKKIAAKKNTKRLGVLEEYEKTNNQIDALYKKQNAEGLTPEEARELINLEKVKLDNRNKEGKSWAELKTERAILAKHSPDIDGKLLATFDQKDLESVIKQISESQLKAIKESGLQTKQAMESITRKWHEENAKAPKNESEKHLANIGKLYDVLKDKKGMTDIEAQLPTMHAFAQPVGGNVTITLQDAERIKKEVDTKKEDLEDIRDDRTRDRTEEGKAERKVAGEQAKQLNKASNELEKLIEKLKSVPEKVGGVEAPAGFKTTIKRPS